MSSLVTELRIIEGNNNIFDTDIDYIIPLYQRAYAWEDKQLTQFIEDISDVSEDSNYYIGSLIVSRQGNRYEVVDGQQRLTSLYLLLNCLGFNVKPTLMLIKGKDKRCYHNGSIFYLFFSWHEIANIPLSSSKQTISIISCYLCLFPYLFQKS